MEYENVSVASVFNDLKIEEKISMVSKEIEKNLFSVLKFFSKEDVENPKAIYSISMLNSITDAKFEPFKAIAIDFAIADHNLDEDFEWPKDDIYKDLVNIKERLIVEMARIDG